MEGMDPNDHSQGRHDVDIEQVPVLNRQGLLPCPTSIDGPVVDA